MFKRQALHTNWQVLEQSEQVSKQLLLLEDRGTYWSLPHRWLSSGFSFSPLPALLHSRGSLLSHSDPSSLGSLQVGNDWFLVANDFADYLAKQDEVDALYRNQVCCPRAGGDGCGCCWGKGVWCSEMYLVDCRLFEGLSRGFLFNTPIFFVRELGRLCVRVVSDITTWKILPLGLLSNIKWWNKGFSKPARICKNKTCVVQGVFHWKSLRFEAFL